MTDRTTSPPPPAVATALRHHHYHYSHCNSCAVPCRFTFGTTCGNFPEGLNTMVSQACCFIHRAKLLEAFCHIETHHTKRKSIEELYTLAAHLLLVPVRESCSNKYVAPPQIVRQLKTRPLSSFAVVPLQAKAAYAVSKALQNWGQGRGLECLSSRPGPQALQAFRETHLPSYCILL